MKFTDSHEWIRVTDGEGTVGISEHAQKELGEVVYIELPSVGREVKAGEEVVVIESTKAASDVYSPVAGTVVAVNDALREDPSLINRSAEEAGWLFVILVQTPSELDTLLDHPEYLHLIS